MDMILEEKMGVIRLFVLVQGYFFLDFFYTNVKELLNLGRIIILRTKRINFWRMK